MLEAFTKFQTCVLCLVKVCLYISSFMSMIHKWIRIEREREKCAFITKHYECMEEETWKKHTLRQYIYICPIDRVDNICVRGVRVGCGAMMHATTKQASNFCNKTNQPKIYLSIFFFVMFYSSLVPCVSPAFSSGVLCVGWLLQPTLSRPSLLQQKKNYIKNQQQPHIHVFGTNNNWAKWMKQYFLNAVLFK